MRSSAIPRHLAIAMLCALAATGCSRPIANALADTAIADALGIEGPTLAGVWDVTFTNAHGEPQLHARLYAFPNAPIPLGLEDRLAGAFDDSPIPGVTAEAEMTLFLTESTPDGAFNWKTNAFALGLSVKGNLFPLFFRADRMVATGGTVSIMGKLAFQSDTRFTLEDMNATILGFDFPSPQPGYIRLHCQYGSGCNDTTTAPLHAHAQKSPQPLPDYNIFLDSTGLREVLENIEALPTASKFSQPRQ